MSTGLVLEATITIATTDAELAEHHCIRHAVFVVEQEIFTGSDTDDHDGPDALRVLARYDGVPAGTVRLYPLDGRPSVWQGDRLAVLPRFRAHNVGAPLVRYAVTTAGALGGSAMVAHIQPPNVRFFERLGWSRDGGTEIYCGRPHVPMRITLTS